jgi:hypothetical protein
LRQTESSRNRRRLLQGALGKREDFVHLRAADGWKPLQEFVYGRALVDVFEQCSDRQARAAETPRPA